jgi:glycosyltransferase involved in cell wall biosynthesis
MMKDSTSKKIAMLLPNLSGGGAERMGVYVANGLASHGFDVDMVLFDASGVHRDLLSQSVRVLDLQSGGAMRSILPLARYLRRERPAVMFSNLDHVNVAALAAKKAARGSTRVIPIVHTTLSAAKRFFTGLKNEALRFAIRKTYPWADAIIVVSHGSAEDLIQTTGVAASRVRTIFPILTQNIASLAAAPVDHPWLVPGQPDVIVAAGRLTVQKNFPLLIRAFAEVRRRRECRLLICGEGPERSALEELAAKLGVQNDISLPGFCKNIFAHMARSSVFVLSSWFEAMPMVLVEAMACGCPVVSVDCKCGPREILDNGRFGTLVPANDPTALADGIDGALGKPRAPIPNEALRPFEAERVIQQYVDLIQEVAST